MNNGPMTYAMIAVFLALGEAVGEGTLQRAGNFIRDVITDGALGPETADILEMVLVGIDYAADPDPDQPYTDLGAQLAHATQ